MYSYLYGDQTVNGTILKEYANASSLDIPDETFTKVISNMELSRSEDYLWYSVRHANAYVDVHVCGRKWINGAEKNGIDNSELEECIPSYFQPYSLIKTNSEARWYGIYFSPMIAGESMPKVWIRFPEEDKPVWFFMKGSGKDIELIPDPRRKATLRLLEKHDQEVMKILREYSKTINYCRKEAYDFFERNGVGKPAISNKEERVGFLVYPFPKKRSGDGVKLGTVMPICRDL